MKLKKWLLGLMTFAAMAVICAVCVGAETYEDFKYSVLDDGTVEITGYNGSDGNVDIPSEIDGMTVTRIDLQAFYGCESIKSITIPGSMTEIGDSAFYRCTSLKSITIPSGVTSIGDEVFHGCASLTSITIPNSVTEIGKDAFYGCTSLTAIDVATGNKYYVSENGVLYNKDKTDLICYPAGKKDENYKIPDGVTEIGNSIFRYCTNLTNITIPDSVTNIGYSAFMGCTSLKSITIPDGVAGIYYYTFSGCISLESITIPDSVTEIGNGAFGGCTSLKSITIPNRVTSIGIGAFNDCASLTEINVTTGNQNYISANGVLYNKDKTAIICYPAGKKDKNYTITDGAMSIGYRTFYGCTNLTSITIPNGVTSIGSSAFENCTSLASITIPNGVTSIGSSTFENCTSLASITIPDSVTSIDWRAFGGCESLTSITIPDSVTEIGFSVFEGCASLTSITIPNSVTSIGENTFVGCTSLKSITIPDSVTSIEWSAFSGCASLTSITIPNSVTSIGDYAFKDCTSLKSITIPNGVTDISEQTFSGCTSLISITIPDSVTSIGESTFYDCTNLTSITIPDSVTSIGDSAFNGCTSLTSIAIPDSVTSIGEWAFENCTSLTSIAIPSSVTEIGSYYNDFVGCTSLTAINVAAENQNYVSVNGVLFNKDKTTIICYPAGKKDKNYKIPDGVTWIGDSAFEGCTSLASITIPDSVTWIRDSAFNGCASLTSITIPNSVTRIDYIFSGCTSLTAINVAAENQSYVSVNGVLCNKDKTTVICYPAGKKDENYKIPDGVTWIGDSAFEDCISLTSITIPDSVTSIGVLALKGCTSLTSITIPDSVTEIGSGAFEDCVNLTNIAIPNSVTSIDDRTFYGCTSLTSIAIPDNVTYISYFAFSGCASLTSINVATGNQNYVSVNGVLCNEDKTTIICYPAGKKDKSYKIPDGVKSIGDYAFSGCASLTSITIPNSVTVIGRYAFDDCTSLTSITIPSSVTEIGESAFGYYYNEHDDSIKKIEGFKIYCNIGTVGEQYAKYNGFDYEILDRETQCAHNNTEIHNAKNADCATDGYTGDTYCKDCGAKISSGEVIPATGKHSFGNWKITKAATCTATGTKTRTCSVCGKVETATIAKTAHKYVNTVVKPTYTAQGYTLHKCSVCGTSYKDTYTAKLTLAKVTGAKLTGRAADALRINWSKNASADGYIVEMYQNGKWVRVAKITKNNTTTFRKAGLKAGTAYKFRVRAYKISGKTVVYGAYSATVAARTNPSVVKGAKLTGRAADALRINWTKNTTADGYIVEMYKGGKWVRVAKITNNSTTTFRKAGLKASTVYKFRVKAYKMSGKTALYGNYSATVTARTNPSAVKGVKIAGKAKDALRVNWTKNTSAQGYIVEMYKGGKWVKVAKITKNSTNTYRKAGLAKNTTYKFRVKAYYMSGKTALYGNYGSVSGKTAVK